MSEHTDKEVLLQRRLRLLAVALADGAFCVVMLDATHVHRLREVMAKMLRLKTLDIDGAAKASFLDKYYKSK